ncbi:hypothetical protein L917_03414, partial [Phytophthora nicotianae]
EPPTGICSSSIEAKDAKSKGDGEEGWHGSGRALAVARSAPKDGWGVWSVRREVACEHP